MQWSNDRPPLYSQIIEINNFQRTRFARRITRGMFDTVAGKHIAIFGFSFKKNTADTRESAAIYVCQQLIEEGARLRIFDPKVKHQQVISDLNDATEKEDTGNFIGVL